MDLLFESARPTQSSHEFAYHAHDLALFDRHASSDRGTGGSKQSPKQSPRPSDKLHERALRVVQPRAPSRTHWGRGIVRADKLGSRPPEQSPHLPCASTPSCSLHYCIWRGLAIALAMVAMRTSPTRLVRVRPMAWSALASGRANEPPVHTTPVSPEPEVSLRMRNASNTILWFL